MVKYIEANGQLNQINKRMTKHIEEKVKMVENPRMQKAFKSSKRSLQAIRKTI